MQNLLNFKKAGNDHGVSMLTSFFYKTLFKEAAEEDADSDDLKNLLMHARDIWFPMTLGSLSN